MNNRRKEKTEIQLNTRVQWKDRGDEEEKRPKLTKLSYDTGLKKMMGGWEILRLLFWMGGGKHGSDLKLNC